MGGKRDLQKLRQEMIIFNDNIFHELIFIIILYLTAHVSGGVGGVCV